MKIRNLLLIGSIVALVTSMVLSGCSKDDMGGDSGTFTDSRDSKSYKWVRIGDQVWMAENLAYIGSDIQHITDDKEWSNNKSFDGWCYHKNDESNAKTYGVLYQWKAAKIACPDGWHLPTDEEWNTLVNYLKENGYSCDGVDGGENIAKSLAAGSGWKTSDHEYSIGNTDYPEYRNKSGFSALPGSNRKSTGSFTSTGLYGYWWTATDNDSNLPSLRNLKYDKGKIYSYTFAKDYGYAVRCIKD